MKELAEDADLEKALKDVMAKEKAKLPRLPRNWFSPWRKTG